MVGLQADLDGYLDGFFRGIEFVLLAMEGRLASADLDPREAEALVRFLREYQTFLEAHETARLASASDDPLVGWSLEARLPPGSRN